MKISFKLIDRNNVAVEKSNEIIQFYGLKGTFFGRDKKGK